MARDRGGTTLDNAGLSELLEGEKGAQVGGGQRVAEGPIQHGFDSSDDHEFGRRGREEDEDENDQAPATPEDLFAAAHLQTQAALHYEQAKAAAKAAKIALDFASWRVRKVYRTLAKQRGIDPDLQERR